MNDYKYACRSEHTQFLGSYFPIGSRGVDWYNPNNLAIEFKESYMRNISDMWFRVPKEQVEKSDILVFCVYQRSFYCVMPDFIKKTYNVGVDKTYKIRLNPIKIMSFFTCHDINILKEFLLNIERSDLE